MERHTTAVVDSTHANWYSGSSVGSLVSKLETCGSGGDQRWRGWRLDALVRVGLGSYVSLDLLKKAANKLLAMRNFLWWELIVGRDLQKLEEISSTVSIC